MVFQLRKCAKDLRACGETYWKLYQSAFDADKISLAHIQMYPFTFTKHLPTLVLHQLVL